jgi:hypothetical protein
MSARKKVNQSRPRALACGDALAVAGAVCFNAASDGRPSSARRSSRPPSNSSASVDSPLSPAPRGTTASVFGRMPLASGPPDLLGYPAQGVPQHAPGTPICKGGNFEKCCEFRGPQLAPLLHRRASRSHHLLIRRSMFEYACEAFVHAPQETTGTSWNVYSITRRRWLRFALYGTTGRSMVRPSRWSWMAPPWSWNKRAIPVSLSLRETSLDGRTALIR